MAKCPNCGGKLVKTKLNIGGAGGGGRHRNDPTRKKPLANPDVGMYLVCTNEDCGNYLVMDGRNPPTSEQCPECKQKMHEAPIARTGDNRLPEDGEAKARGQKEVYQCQKCKSVFPPKAVGG